MADEWHQADVLLAVEGHRPDKISRAIENVQTSYEV